VDIAQLAYVAEECILCHEGSDVLFPNDFGEDYYYICLTAFFQDSLDKPAQERQNHSGF